MGGRPSGADPSLRRSIAGLRRSAASRQAWESPSEQGGEFTSGAGSPVVFFAQRPNGIAVKNDTCTDYFLRVVLELPPFPPAAPDGGLAKPEVDAGAADGAEQADGGR